jgi:hypothetical protein
MAAWMATPEFAPLRATRLRPSHDWSAGTIRGGVNADVIDQSPAIPPVVSTVLFLSL